ncbi:MAG: hypothetical protein R6X14_10070 [bacterium]
MNRSRAAALAVLLTLVACDTLTERYAPGTVYRQLARPEIWQLLPGGQAEQLGLLPGDLLLSYNLEPVASNADVVAAQGRAVLAAGPVKLVVLRGGRELRFETAPGPLGALPVASRHPSGLAVALEESMRRLRLFADHDWLAALTGESFSFAAAAGECRAWWPGGEVGSYLEDAAMMAGLELDQVYSLAAGGDAFAIIRMALEGDRPVLVLGGWPGHRASFWGVATRFDPEQGEQGLLFGHTLDSADELPLTGLVAEVYLVDDAGNGWDDLDEVLALVLTQALELGLARNEDGWQTGLQAYDQLIVALDTVPFCPVCGPEESPVCFDRLLWAMVAHKQSAMRFLDAMREVVPEHTALVDEIGGDMQAQVARLEGIVRSRVRVGELEDQRRIAQAIAEVQLIENDLLGLYEQLLARL